MKAEEVKKLLNTRLKKVRKHFRKLSENFDQEVLHDFRLEMKKLKALMRLLNSTIPNHKGVKLSKEINAFYTLSGNLRNLYLHEQRIRALVSEYNLKMPIAYLTLLGHEKMKTEDQLRMAAEKTDFRKLGKEILALTPTNLSAQDCQNYLVQQLNTLTGIFAPASFSDEALHEVRKIIKDIGYNRTYLGTYMSLILPLGLVRKDQADALAERLGVFHDLCVSLHLLQSPTAGQVTEQAERGILQDLISVIEADKKRMKVELVHQLSSI